MNALTFHNTNLSIMDRDGLPWLAGPEIGEALGYSDPGKHIGMIYTRHKEEFSPDMSRTLKMRARDGRMNTIRVFSPRGALLLAMHSQTARAVAFRAWVLDILEGKLALPGVADRMTRLTTALLLARPRWERHLRYRQMGLSHSEISRLEGVSASLVTLDANSLREVGLIHTPKRPGNFPRQRALAVQS